MKTTKRIRYMPVYLQLCGIVDSGNVGELAEMIGDYIDYTFNPPEFSPRVRSCPPMRRPWRLSRLSVA